MLGSFSPAGMPVYQRVLTAGRCRSEIIVASDVWGVSDGAYRLIVMKVPPATRAHSSWIPRGSKSKSKSKSTSTAADRSVRSTRDAWVLRFAQDDNLFLFYVGNFILGPARLRSADRLFVVRGKARPRWRSLAASLLLPRLRRGLYLTIARLVRTRIRRARSKLL
jgi:hypothetical protein